MSTTQQNSEVLQLTEDQRTALIHIRSKYQSFLKETDLVAKLRDALDAMRMPDTFRSRRTDQRSRTVAIQAIVNHESEHTQGIADIRNRVQSSLETTLEGNRFEEILEGIEIALKYIERFPTLKTGETAETVTKARTAYLGQIEAVRERLEISFKETEPFKAPGSETGSVSKNSPSSVQTVQVSHDAETKAGENSARLPDYEVKINNQLSACFGFKGFNWREWDERGYPDTT